MDFTGVSLPFGIDGMLQTAVEFLGIYKDYIIIVLGSIACVLFSGPLLKLVNYAADKVAGFMIREGRGGEFSAEEKQSYRREMYDYLTKTGRIEERDTWVKKTGNPY